MSLERLPLDANGHLISRGSEVDVRQRPDGEEPRILGVAQRCAFCDCRPVLRVDEDGVHAQDPCPFPDGITTEITIEVPSGKLLVTDNLRPIYDWEGDTSASYNSAVGQAQAIEAMATIGCAYGPVGNSCPSLYRTGPDSYIIANPCYDDGKPSLPENACLAIIITDLWAYSCADFEHWKARGGDPDTLGWSDSVVELTPGRYRFVHHTGERAFDRDAPGTIIFAHVERITDETGPIPKPSTTGHRRFRRGLRSCRRRLLWPRKLLRRST